MKYSYIILCIILISGCSEDFFTNELEVDLIEQDELLNVVAIIDGNEQNLFATVSNTRVSGSEDPFKQIDDAEILFYEDDTFISELENIGNGQYVFSDSFNINPQSTSYRLTVQHPDYPDTDAVIEKPNVVELAGVLIDRDRTNIDDDVVTSVRLNDPAGDNYYLLSAEGIREGERRENIYLRSDFEGIFTETGFGLLFNDVTFNDSNTELLISISTFRVNEYDEFEFSLTSLNKEFYDYLVTAEYASDNRDNPFAEPVLIPEHFKDAVGVFGMFFTSIKEATVE